MKLLFATSNSNKISAANHLLGQSIRVSGLKDSGILESIPELSYSFYGNAMEKALYVASAYSVNCFSEDSGLVVDALNGAPGIYTSRYADTEATAKDNITKLLGEMSEKTDRNARFVAVICLFCNGRVHFFSGKVEGRITEAARGDNGFGYDPIFIPHGFDRTFAEMTMDEKNTMSHRKYAMEKMASYFADLSA